MMRNQAIHLRISAAHFFRDSNAPVRAALAFSCRNLIQRRWRPSEVSSP
jgi:hypothetical protein